MKQWKHLTLEQRKVIASGISHKYKLKIIGENLQVDPTSISKEVKRNRIEISNGSKKLKDGPLYVRVAIKDSTIAHILNINMMLVRLKKKLTLI